MKMSNWVLWLIDTINKHVSLILYAYHHFLTVQSS